MAIERDEIVDKLNLYALAVDTQRWDLFDRVFTEHCGVDFGTNSRWTERERFKADFAAYHAPFDATQHVMSNHQVSFEGEHAWSLVYGNWRLVRHAASASGEGALWEGSGWYDDHWVRTHGGWRIQKRVCRVIWSTGNDRVRETMPGVTFGDANCSLRQEASESRIGFLTAIS